MKQKILSLIFAVCLIIPAILMLNACGKENKPSQVKPPQEPQIITITYHSEYGDLSFETKEVELNNGIYLLTESNLPMISNEGDERIFDYWADENDIEFDFSNHITTNLELYAVFDDAELVWEETWNKYNSLATFCADYTQRVSLNENGGLTNLDTNLGSKPYNPTFKKIKKSECLSKYITKEEYQDLPISLCFITDNQTNKKIVTEDDFTLNTYCCYEFLFIEDVYYGQCSAIKYLPKGIDISSWSGVLDPAWQYSLSVSQEKFGIDIENVEYEFSQSGHNVLYLSVDEVRKLTPEIFGNMINDLNYNYSTNKNWQEDEYYTFVTYNWVKFKCTLKNYDIKYFILKESAPGYYTLFENISEEEYDSYTIQ